VTRTEAKAQPPRKLLYRETSDDFELAEREAPHHREDLLGTGAPA
jgi:hypothetical protein